MAEKTELIVEETLLMKELRERNSELYFLIIEVAENVKPLLNERISMVFPTYTQHDIGHSIRVIQHIEKIVLDIKELNNLEIAIIVLTALLHDIGMAALEEEVIAMKNEDIVYDGITYQNMLVSTGGNDIEALQEYIRRVHAKRSADYIRKHLATRLRVTSPGEFNFSEIVADICESHTNDISWIQKNLNRTYRIGDFDIYPHYYAALLRLGDILDFDSCRTPKKLYEAINPQGISKDEWEQHFTINNSDKIFVSDRNKKKYIRFYGNCTNPKIHRKVLSYMEWVNEEITNAIELTEDYDSTRKIELYHKVLDEVQSKDYSIVDLKFNMNYQNTIKHLMGESLYGDKTVGLRELVQNSIDACKILEEEKGKQINNNFNEYRPKIYIEFDEYNNEVKIKDNGIGMTLHTINHYFLEIGASYYKSKEYKLAGYQYKPIGNYGIGFLASFMLSDYIKVKTRHYKSSSLITVDIQKDNEYVVIKETEDTDFVGTEIVLNFQHFFEVFKDLAEVKNFIKKNFWLKGIEVKIGTEILSLENLIMSSKYNYEIDLSKYLNQIEARLYLNKKLELRIVETFKDLDSGSFDYCFDGMQLLKVRNNNIRLSNYIYDNKITRISFMEVEDADDLERVIEMRDEDFIDDIEDVYREKFHNDDVVIAIKPSVNIMKFNQNYLEEVDEIADGLSFKELDKFSGFIHDNSKGTFFDKWEISIWEVQDIEKYIELGGGNRISHVTSQIHVRDVFVESPRLKIYNQSIFRGEIKELKLNISDSLIIPNVSRNGLSKKDRESIEQAIGEAIKLYVLEEMEDEEEKTLFKEFLKKNPIIKSELLNREYMNLLNGE